jgi:hypothetical protein
VPGSKVGDSLRNKGPTTSRVRRHENADGRVPVGNFAPTAIIPAPSPRPIRPPRSLGDFATASVEEITAVVVEHFRPSGSKTCKPQQETREFLGYLAGFPGDTWQERWEASGHDAGRPVGQAAGDNVALRRRRPASMRWNWRWPRPLSRLPTSVTASKPWSRAAASGPADLPCRVAWGVRSDFLYEIKATRSRGSRAAGPGAGRFRLRHRLPTPALPRRKHGGETDGAATTLTQDHPQRRWWP